MTWKIRQASDRSGAIGAHYAGSGPVLVLVHGVGLRSDAWLPAGAHLTSEFEVHAVDMPGHGLSPLGSAEQLSDYVSRLAKYIAGLGDHVFIAGHSMGAMIALALATDDAPRVAGVAAVNAIYRRTAKAAAAVQSRAKALDPQQVSDPNPTLDRWFGPAPKDNLRLARQACDTWLRTVDPAGYKAAYTVFAQADGPSDEDLHGLACPALFLTGADDPNSTPKMAAAMAERAPLGRAHTIAGAAHMLPLTHPSQTADLIRQTFRQKGET